MGVLECVLSDILPFCSPQVQDNIAAASPHFNATYCASLVCHQDYARKLALYTTSVNGLPGQAKLLRLNLTLPARNLLFKKGPRISKHTEAFDVGDRDFQVLLRECDLIDEADQSLYVEIYTDVLDIFNGSATPKVIVPAFSPLVPISAVAWSGQKVIWFLLQSSQRFEPEFAEWLAQLKHISVADLVLWY